MWFAHEDRCDNVGSHSRQAGITTKKADYQCMRPGELWQVNWLEETGTICSLVYDIPNKRITTLLNFSKSHWTQPEAAHGDKRNPADFERWRGLAKIGGATERHILNGQADIVEAFRGAGELKPIDPSAPVL